MNVVGISLGVMIGVISGFVLLLLLKTAIRVSNPIMIITEILAIPTFWFGGPWLTTRIMANIVIDEILPPYMSSLALTFVLITVIPLANLVIRIGNELGKVNVEYNVR